MERMQMKQVNSDNLFFVNSYVSLNFTLSSYRAFYDSHYL